MVFISHFSGSYYVGVKGARSRSAGKVSVVSGRLQILAMVVISQSSQQPLATWEWLKFLSYQSLSRQRRWVPARPSVALAANYWGKLPRPVSEAMRIAFPFARPVLIEEYGYFSWEQLAAISSGEQTPVEAVQAMDRFRWFGVDSR